MLTHMRHPFVLLFLLALALRLAYLAETFDTPVWRWQQWRQSDMATFLKTADQIRREGPLVSTPYHPYHNHHRDLGTPDQWRVWLGGEHTFYHVPGFYYVLALLLEVSGESILLVKLMLITLGAAQAAVLGLAAEKMAGRTVGLIAGALALLYGPSVAADAMILREGIGGLLAAAGLYMVLLALESSEPAPVPRSRRLWLMAGLTLGCGALIKETAMVLFGGVWLWAAGQSWLSRRPLPRMAPLLLVLGFAIALTPLVVRNVMTGAPPLATSQIFAYNFALANAADNPVAGSVYYVPPSIKEVLVKADGKASAVVRLTFAGYRGVGQFAANWWNRFSGIWRNVEIPDNFSYAFLVERSILLSALPRFVCIWIPASAALMLLAWRTCRRASTAPEEPVPAFAPRSLSLLLLCLFLHVVALSFNTIVGRYRLIIVPFLIILAAWTLAWTLEALRRRDWLRFAMPAGLMLGLALVWSIWPANSVAEANAIRPIDRLIAVADLVRRNDRVSAQREVERGLSYCSAIRPAEEAFRAACRRTLEESWQEMQEDFAGGPTDHSPMGGSSGN